jgi:hypothetical protein
MLRTLEFYIGSMRHWQAGRLAGPGLWFEPCRIHVFAGWTLEEPLCAACLISPPAARHLSGSAAVMFVVPSEFERFRPRLPS